jgi:uncharacterized protein Veg
MLDKSSGKTVEFCLKELRKKNNAKTVDLKRKFDIVVIVNLCEKTKNSKKVALFL